VRAPAGSAAAVQRIDSPLPQSCPACGSGLQPWRHVRPQEPALRRVYLLGRCPRCGTASTAGAADPTLYETGVYDEETPRLWPLIDAFRRACERQKLGLLRAAVAPPARVLEVGSGQGRFVSAARAAGYEATGVEPSRRGVEAAAARGVSLVQAGLEDADLAVGGYHGVVLWHVLEHLDQPAPALERIRTLLVNGGALLVGVPNSTSLQAAIGGARWLHWDVPRHRHHFSPVGLRTLLAASEFAVEAEHHLLLEHNPFGMWQAWLDRTTRTPSYAYNLIKHNASPNARDLLPTLALTALAPLAFAAEAIAGLARRGGTIAVLARRR
jgi:SAM-dependent methyltransferase